MLSAGSRSTGSPFLIGLATVVILGAMVLAIPPASIKGDRGGYLVRHSRFGERLVEQIAGQGYGYLVLDLSGARLDDDALWRKHLEGVDRRRFPVWGWIDERTGASSARELVKDQKLAGLFVYGADALSRARALRGAKPDLKVIPVLAFGDPRPEEGAFAVAMNHERFLAGAGGVPLPVLIADQLDAARIETARAAIDGDYVVARVTLK